MDINDKQYKDAMIELLRIDAIKIVDNDQCYATMSAAFHERILFTARKLKELRCSS